MPDLPAFAVLVDDAPAEHVGKHRAAEPSLIARIFTIAPRTVKVRTHVPRHAAPKEG